MAALVREQPSNTSQRLARRTGRAASTQHRAERGLGGWLSSRLAIGPRRNHAGEKWDRPAKGGLRAAFLGQKEWLGGLGQYVGATAKTFHCSLPRVTQPVRDGRQHPWVAKRKRFLDIPQPLHVDGLRVGHNQSSISSNKRASVRLGWW